MGRVAQEQGRAGKDAGVGSSLHRQLFRFVLFTF